MKITLPHINTLLLIAACVMMFFVLRGGNTRKLDTEVAKKDVEIVTIKSERDRARDSSNFAFNQLRVVDSLLKLKSQTVTKIIYEKIPATVNSFSNEELRRAVRNFKPIQ